MSPSLCVSDKTKSKLSRLKRDDETWDELLSRLADYEEPINVGAWSEEEADRAGEAIERSRDSFDQ